MNQPALQPAPQSRISQTFERLKAERRVGLVAYTMAFDPTPEISAQILHTLPEAGADIIEVGMAFSDPMADGPTIQAAANRALKAGARIKTTLEMVYNFRQKNVRTPIILMGYYNPIFKYGVREFCADAAAAGVDGLIIVDLPPEEEGEIIYAAAQKNLALIHLVAPTTPETRLDMIMQNAGGFIYYVSMAGVTGTKTVNPHTIAPYVQSIKQHTKLPVAVGFGIKTVQNAREVAKYCDAVVIGSAIVEKIGDFAKNYSSKSSPAQLNQEIYEFVKSVKDVL